MRKRKERKIKNELVRKDGERGERQGGDKVKKYCCYCANPIHPFWKFCTNCGEKL